MVLTLLALSFVYSHPFALVLKPLRKVLAGFNISSSAAYDVCGCWAGHLSSESVSSHVRGDDYISFTVWS